MYGNIINVNSRHDRNLSKQKAYYNVTRKQ